MQYSAKMSRFRNDKIIDAKLNFINFSSNFPILVLHNFAFHHLAELIIPHIYVYRDYRSDRVWLN